MKNIYTYNGNIEGGLSSKIYNSATFSKRKLKSLGVFRHSVEKPHTTCITQLVNSIVFESFYCIGSSQQNVKNYFMIF